MLRRSTSVRALGLGLVLTATLGMQLDDAWAKEAPPGLPGAAVPGDKLEWITLATEDLAFLRRQGDFATVPGEIDERATHGGLSLLLVDEGQLVAISRLMHKHFHRCAGFVYHPTLDAAIDHLYTLKAADPEAIFVTYTIDNPAVAQALIGEVQATNIISTINLLAGNTTRYYTHAGGVNAANQLKARWETYAAGRSDVSVALFSHAGWAQPSVIATITGTTLPSEVVVVGGHLDSINSASPTSGTAPGADDDASGVAALTEAFRAAMAQGFRPERTVKFMAYAAEEVGLRGSREIAQAHKAQGIDVVGVLQLDMTNFKGSTIDIGFVSDNTNAAQTTFVRDLVTTYLPTLTHTTTACGYACSDHASWHNEGFAASLPFEALVGQHNTRIHTANDTLANSDATAAHAAKFARVTAAYLAELAKGSLGSGPTPNFAVACTPATLSAAPGGSASSTCTVSSSGGFSSAVTLACSGLPAGVTCSYAPSSVTPPANGSVNSSLQVNVAAGTAAGSYSLQAQGTSGSMLRSASLGLTVTSTSNALPNGVPVPIAGATGSSTFYTLSVPAGAPNVQFVTAGGTGDLDLYVRFGSPPTTSSADCSSTSSTNSEVCTFSTPSAGTYHVLIYGFSAYSGAQLTGTSVTPGQTTVTLYSIAAEDGRISESSETSNAGGSGNSSDNNTSSLRLGDWSNDTQYRNILSFDTSSIPDGATIVSATLRLKRGTLSGSNPFSTHGSCTVDVHSSGFGGSAAFATGDFQATATATGVTTLSNPTSNGSFATGTLNAAGLAAINKTGKTQFRVYFTLDDNDDLGADYVGVYSGEAATANRPQLVVVYQ